MERPTFIDRLQDIQSGLSNLQQDVYNAACAVVSDDRLRPDHRVDRVMELDEIIKGLRRLYVKIHQIGSNRC